MSFQKILVAIDNSQLTQAVFEQGLELALLGQGSLMLLHCLSNDLIGAMVPILVEVTLYPAITNDSYEAWNLHYDKQRSHGLTILTHYGEIATSQGVPTELNLSAGEAGLCLCQTAKNWGADLIILGRRGRTGLAEALLGSVSNYVLHHAPCSTLVMQTDKQGISTQSLPEVTTVADQQGSSS